MKAQAYGQSTIGIGTEKPKFLYGVRFGACCMVAPNIVVEAIDEADCGPPD